MKFEAKISGTSSRARTRAWTDIWLITHSQCDILYLSSPSQDTTASGSAAQVGASHAQVSQGAGHVATFPESRHPTKCYNIVTFIFVLLIILSILECSSCFFIVQYFILHDGSVRYFALPRPLIFSYRTFCSFCIFLCVRSLVLS